MSKIELIKQYKETAIAALNSCLDSMYNLTDKYFDKDGKMLPLPERNEKVENFIQAKFEDYNPGRSYHKALRAILLVRHQGTVI